jgi:hypothetical protein
MSRISNAFDYQHISIKEPAYRASEDGISDLSLELKWRLFELDDLSFAAAPKDDRYHVELRTESYLTEPVFELLERHGVGQVLSHWTCLPPLRVQFAKSGHRFLNSGKSCVIRLMTPLRMRYEDAYAKAHPFDKMVDGVLQESMLEDAVHLIRRGMEQEVQVNVIINNRSGGNAPEISRMLAQWFLAGMDDVSW